MMYSKVAAAIAVIACLVLGTISASAQTGFRSKYDYGEPRFAIEAVIFRSDREGLYTLEVYYKIFYNALSYKKTPLGYLAEYEVGIVVEDGGGGQIEGLIREGKIQVDSYAETRRTTDFIINLVTVTLAQQDISITAVLTDKTSLNEHKAQVDVNNRDYWNKYPTLSGVEFAREVDEATRDSKFNKGDMRVIPSVARLFGGDRDSLLVYYQEVYPGKTNIKYAKVVSRIYHRNKGFVYADTIDYGEINDIKRELHTIDVSDLMPGDYELEIRLEGRRGKVYDKLIEEFELELTAESIFRNDFEMAVEMLKYLATKAERDKLKDAKTADERKRLWDEFWQLRGDKPKARENPTREEYFRRVRHANRYFSFMKKEGWKTTRGMIYITYGEPDEVEDHPFELATKPYQVWLYYRTSPPRRFLFIDEWGDGNYELQPPYNGLDW